MANGREGLRSALRIGGEFLTELGQQRIQRKREERLFKRQEEREEERFQRQLGGREFIERLRAQLKEQKMQQLPSIEDARARIQGLLKPGESLPVATKQGRITFKGPDAVEDPTPPTTAQVSALLGKVRAEDPELAVQDLEIAIRDLQVRRRVIPTSIIDRLRQSILAAGGNSLEAFRAAGDRSTEINLFNKSLKQAVKQRLIPTGEKKLDQITASAFVDQATQELGLGATKSQIRSRARELAIQDGFTP